MHCHTHDPLLPNCRAPWCPGVTPTRRAGRGAPCCATLQHAPCQPPRSEPGRRAQRGAGRGLFGAGASRFAGWPAGDMAEALTAQFLQGRAARSAQILRRANRPGASPQCGSDLRVAMPRRPPMWEQPPCRDGSSRGGTRSHLGPCPSRGGTRSHLGPCPSQGGTRSHLGPHPSRGGPRSRLETPLRTPQRDRKSATVGLC